MITKSISELSLPITEEEYRKDGKMHYSTLSRFAKTGFNGLSALFDKIETPSLTFGSIVDELITGTMESFNEKFVIAEYPDISDNLIQIAKTLYSRYGTDYLSVTDISDDILAEVGRECGYYANDKYSAYRVKLIKENCDKYYKLLLLSAEKTLISSKDYQDACACVQALQTSPATKWYFYEDSPFDSVERQYQLKFAAEFDGIEYSIMADEIIVDHKKKEIYLIDLKTSSKNEWDFYKSFIEWGYAHQARLYYRVIKANLEKDDYFKDFTIHDYRFIVVNKKSLIPLVWHFNQTKTKGTLYLGKNNSIEIRDPFDLAKELNEYLEYEYNVPIDIEIEETNDIVYWINNNVV